MTFRRWSFFILLFNASLFAAPVHADSDTLSRDRRTVTVQGVGKAQAVPDIATLRIEVSQEGASLDAISSDVRKGMSAILERLHKEGVADKDVQTESYQVIPRYEQDKRGNPHRSGFRVSNRVAAKIRDLKKVGKILASVTEAGATSVTGPEFDVDNHAQVEREALAKAMEDAKANAAILATTAGATLDEVVTINQSNTNPWPGPRPLMAMRAMAVQPSESSEPVEAGEQTIQATLTASFALK
jgi:uncharacterized protein